MIGKLLQPKKCNDDANAVGKRVVADFRCPRTSPVIQQCDQRRRRDHRLRTVVFYCAEVGQISVGVGLFSVNLVIREFLKVTKALHKIQEKPKN